MANIAFSNPPTVHKPGRYHHAALITNAGKRLVLSGQVGTAPDGTIHESAEKQIGQALANIGALLEAHGMTVANVVKVNVFITDLSLLDSLRTQRAAFFGDHIPASTLLVVAGLADPRFKVEIEAEAVA
ncbi:MAG: RidA family protein [Proteobacteria bacterium]|nr:RidA family protein [Pseudomonadota bacterium]